MAQAQLEPDELAIPWDDLRMAVGQIAQGQKTSAAGYGWVVQEISPEGWIRITLDRDSLGLPKA